VFVTEESNAFNIKTVKLNRKKWKKSSFYKEKSLIGLNPGRLKFKTANKLQKSSNSEHFFEVQS
jgi:hypothetical protein